MERESKTGVELKQLDEAGTGLARIATLDVIDADGDLTVKGAFGEQHVQVLPVHNWGSVPLGKARVFEKGNEALAEFKLNLETVIGKEWHTALLFDLNNGKPIQDWSYGFTVEEASFEERDDVGRVRILEKLTVHEVSPVVVGSGVDTGTLAIKSAPGKRATPSHSTATSTVAWDGPANRRRARSDEDVAYYRRVFAWRDPGADVGAKSSWKFIHHFVDGDGAPGAASTRACIMGIAILNGARGGTTIPSADRQGVWNHLAKHLRDADLDPPELRSAEEGGVKLMEQMTFALWDVDAVVERLLEVKRLRVEKGRFLGEESMLGAAELKATIDRMHEAASVLEALIREGDGAGEADRLLARFEAVRSGRYARG